MEASTRQSVRLPARVSRQVRALAKSKGRFFELAEDLVKSTNRIEQKRIKAELARLTFGS